MSKKKPQRKGSAKTKDYRKRYYRNHKKKFFTYMKEYRKTPIYKTYRKKYMKDYYDMHKEKMKTDAKKYYWKNRERILLKRRVINEFLKRHKGDLKKKLNEELKKGK